MPTRRLCCLPFKRTSAACYCILISCSAERRWRTFMECYCSITCSPERIRIHSFTPRPCSSFTLYTHTKVYYMQTQRCIPKHSVKQPAWNLMFFYVFKIHYVSSRSPGVRFLGCLPLQCTSPTWNAVNDCAFFLTWLTLWCECMTTIWVVSKKLYTAVTPYEERLAFVHMEGFCCSTMHMPGGFGRTRSSASR